MGEKTIVCPSGLSGVIRNMKVAELNHLANRAAMRSGEAFERILRACWVKTEDPGRAYDESILSSLSWSRVLSADRFFALVQIRALTWGNEYKFRAPCPDCGDISSLSIDLERDLVVRPIPDASCDGFRSGSNRFEVWLPDPNGDAPAPDFAPALRAAEAKAKGTWDEALPDPSRGWAVVLRLLDGRAEVAGAKDARKRPEERVSVSIKHRVVEVLADGIGDEPVAVAGWVDFLDAPILRDLDDLAADLDGGIDPLWDGFVCKTCGYDEGVELPFDLAFWTPPKRKKSASRGRRRRR